MTLTPKASRHLGLTDMDLECSYHSHEQVNVGTQKMKHDKLNKHNINYPQNITHQDGYSH